MKEYIVTVMALDRVGIVRDVSSALSGIGGNITHMNQTVMRGYFTLIVSVEMPEERTQLEIRQAVERNGDVGEFEVNVRPFVEPHPSVLRPSERFVLSLRGNDKHGIIASVTSFLADTGINIDDFYAYIVDKRFIMLVQVSIPIETNLNNVQSGLEQLGKEFELTVHLQHENIFRATSEVRPMMEFDSATR